MTQGQSCDALTSLNSGDESLHVVGDVVEDDVVATGVAHDILVQPHHVVAYVSLQTEEETRLHIDITSWSTGVLSGYRDLCLILRGCLHHLAFSNS